jgi:putative RNA 2'-phosphotransferase
VNKKEEVHLSKFLSFVLRHQPDEIKLVLDINGWANVNELISKAKEHQNLVFTVEDVATVVVNNSKQRFMLSEDKTRIKANQGHSVQVELDLVDTQPPQYLYHGTAKQFIPSILKEGLKAMQRHDVHLSFNTDVAVTVGKRHGEPVVLRINAQKMHQDGLTFQCTVNNVWLTKYIDPKYIELNF